VLELTTKEHLKPLVKKFIPKTKTDKFIYVPNLIDGFKPFEKGETATKYYESINTNERNYVKVR